MLESAWKAIFYSLKPDRFKLGVLVFLVILGNVFAYSIPYFFKLIADYVSTTPVEEFSANELTFPLIGIVVFLIGQEISFRIGHILEIKSVLRILDRVTTRLYHQLLERPTSYFEDKFSGELGRRVEQISTGVLYFVQYLPWELGWQVLSVLASIVLLFVAHPYLFATILVWLVLFLGVSSFLLRWQYAASQKVPETHARLTGNMIDALGNIAIVHSFGGTEYELKHYRAYIDSVVAAERSERWIFLFNKVSQGTSIALLGIGLTFVSLWLFERGWITVGDFVLVATTLPVLTGVVWNFGDTILTVIRQFGTVKNAVEGLQTTMPKVLEGTERLKTDNYAIRFNKISFSYRDTKTEVFNDFSLHVADGERVGIVGISGAGKGTLVKLLLRQHDYEEGEITIGNTDIKSLTLESLRKSIAFVPQDTTLFHRTLYDNIRYAKPDATEEEVLEASKRAYAHEFIIGYPHGYQTKVGERGVKLSGGQRQRVALARAILKDASILVLDEATSALDSASEEIVQRGLHILFEKRTVIAIAHRLSTLREMNRIVVMEEGGVVEQGSPQELLQKETSLFKKMWEHQKNGFLVSDSPIT